MKHWNDLTPSQQKDYREGEVELYGFVWHCYYKFISEDIIEIFSDYGDYHQATTHYKSLVVDNVE